MVEDRRLARISRELFIAAIAPRLLESWVLDRMTSLMEELDLPAGKTLYSAGDSPDAIYFMREGAIQLAREDAPPWTLEGRWVIGGFEAVLERPRSRTAMAITDLHLMRIQADDWIEILEDSFDLARGALFNQARTVARLDENLAAKVVIADPAVVPSIPLPSGPLSLVERLAALMEMPMLSGAGVQTLADLAAIVDEVTFEPGDVVLERGVPRERVFFVVEGEAEATRQAPAMVRRFRTRTLVCGAAALDEHASDWRAVAKTTTRALSVRLEEWVDLMEEHFDMVRAALSCLALEREKILEQMALESGGIVLR
ncbi:MAG: cyclic nucleotide-binding domain-containing protein [Myxococcota bacterium]|nr:cyclic nucleotide-binding domain-containing protein [Myxococcota bacterium]